MVKVGRHVFQPGDLLDWRGKPDVRAVPAAEGQRDPHRA